MFALKQVEYGVKVQYVIRQLGVTEQAIHRWRKPYGNRGGSWVRQRRAEIARAHP